MTENLVYKADSDDSEEETLIEHSLSSLESIPLTANPLEDYEDHILGKEFSLNHDSLLPSDVIVSTNNYFAWNIVYIGCIILLWFCFSICLTLYNKWLMSKDHFNFHYPFFITSSHMFLQFILSGLLLYFIPSLRPTQSISFKNYIFKILPNAGATALDIGLSNASFMFITVSFYTMCKSSVAAFVLLFAFIFRLEKVSYRLCGIVFIIILGVLLAVWGEARFSGIGLILVISAAFFSGLRWALTQILLQREKEIMGNPVSVLFHLAPMMAIFLIIISLVAEQGLSIFTSIFFSSLDHIIQTVGLIIIGCVLSFLMVISEYKLVHETGIVTLAVAGIFKEIMTIIISVIVFHDHLSVINILGLIVCLIGIVLYNYLRIIKMKDYAERTVDEIILTSPQEQSVTSVLSIDQLTKINVK